ncbi:MAG: WD40 repeat domain-containing protein [Chloroflexota bacterium]
MIGILSVVIYDLDSDEVVNTIRIRDSTLLEWNSANSDELVVKNTFGGENNISIFNPFTGDVVQELNYDASMHPSYSPDGQYLVLSRNSANISIIDVLETNDYDTVVSLIVDNGLFQAQESIFWMDNTTIATSSLQGEAIIWDISQGSSEFIEQQLDSQFVFSPLIWHPNNFTYVHYISGTDLAGLYILDGYTGKVVAQRLETDELYIQSILLSDGITSLSNGTTINLAQIAEPTIVTALTEPDAVGSVLFELSGSAMVTQIDNSAPYELSGWELVSGAYTLTITPYSDADGAGTAGIPMIVDFTVIASDR